MAGATTGQIFESESVRIEEILSKQIDTILPTLDPIWRDTVVTSQGVGPVSEFSKDFEVNKLYRTGMTGVIEQGAPVNDFMLYGDDATKADLGARLRGDAISRTFPDPLDGAKSKTFDLRVPMRAMYTNLMLTLGEMQMEATPAVIGDVIAPTLQGFAQNLSHTLCNYWYVSQNDDYRLGTVGSVTHYPNVDLGGSAGATTTAIKSSKIVLKNGAYDRFFAGQRLDIYAGASGGNATGNVLNAPTDGGARNSVYVTAVDDIKGELHVVSVGGYHITPGADDVIVYANSGSASSFTGISGVNSWLKNTGVLLGDDAIANHDINVDVHPEFKSFVKTDVGVLTEHKLRQYLRRFHVAKAKLGQSIDSLVASDGVWLSYEAQKIGQYQIDRTGNLSSLSNEGSSEGFAFTFEGKTYKGHTSQYVEDGTVYGWKTSANNWKRYVPPDYSGLQTMGEADSYVPFRFVVPALTGGSSVKYPLMKSSGATNLMTEAVQMPGMLRMQLIPDQAAGMKLSGVTTDTVFGE